MFRYIGIAWDDAQPTSSASARQLGLDWQARPGWDAALHRAGLQVFTTGTRPGVNGAYPLQDDLGVVLGKLFRHRDLGLCPAANVVLTRNDAEHILQSGGRALVHDFWGRHVAFLQTPTGSTCVLRDPSGTLPCFLIRYQGVAVVFSWLEDALELLAQVVHPRVNWDALTAHLLLGALGGRETALEGVSQILPGEAVDLGSGSPTLLWSAVDIARRPTAHSAAEAAHLLHQTVRSCTQSWASCYDTILLRLSGGVDSSILLSCLAPGSTQADVICVNYHSPGSDSDERHYARLAAARAGRDLIERQRDPGFHLDRVLKIARTPGPVLYIGWMNARTDARLASAHAAAALFTGAGGDQLFFEFPRWWPAADYLQLRGLDAGFASAAMDAARLGRVSVWRAIALAMAERVRPDPAAREPWGHAALLAEGTRRQKMERARFVHPSLLHASGLPIGKHTQTAAVMHPLGYYDPFEQASAPELVNPLFSQPIVELCLGLPTYLLTQGGRGRALARRAFAADLPPQIASRRSKGGMEEHITEVLLSNLDVARGMLLEGELARRGLLDRARVEELLSGRPTALAGPISQIHALIGVEAWLTRWPR
ncbi:MAG: asparagine synthase-related protein [Burkholderiaceae bacterium]